MFYCRVDAPYQKELRHLKTLKGLRIHIQNSAANKSAWMNEDTGEIIY